MILASKDAESRAGRMATETSRHALGPQESNPWRRAKQADPILVNIMAVP